MLVRLYDIIISIITERAMNEILRICKVYRIVAIYDYALIVTVIYMYLTVTRICIYIIS